jgi:phage N-6-adenine-methyltransferase
MINNGLFTSNTDEWYTPQDFYDEVNKEFMFTTDVCATHENAKCKHYFTKDDDGLMQEWKGVCWMNPPYGRVIGHWVKKAHDSKCIVVALLPARTDTKWFHDYIYMEKRRHGLLKGDSNLVGLLTLLRFHLCLLSGGTHE